MKHFLLLLFLLPYIENLTAQYIISGQVIFAEDKKPVALASVFLSNTSVGTVTLPDGSFRLNTTAAGRYDLIVSFVGYETIQKSIGIPSEEAAGILIELKPKPRQLDEVVIGEYEEQSWKKWGSFFLNQFIGYGSWADQCKLHNYEKIHFLYSKRKKILKAYCDEQLVIINKKLGYRITYKLEKFQYNFATGVLFYAGFPLFEELESKRENRQQHWVDARNKAYHGSMMHFMRSIYAGGTEKEGFEIRRMLRTENQEKIRIQQLYKEHYQKKIKNGSEIKAPFPPD